MKFINIGFGSLVAANRVLAVVDPDSAPIKRVVQEAKERAMLVDASYGRKTQSVILMDTDHVILSALNTEVIGQRWSEQTGKEEANGIYAGRRWRCWQKAGLPFAGDEPGG